MAQVPDVCDIPTVSDVSVSKRHWYHDIQIIYEPDDFDEDNDESGCCEFVTSKKCEESRFEEEGEIYDRQMSNEFLRNNNNKICTKDKYEPNFIKSEIFDDISPCINPLICKDECLKLDNDEIDCHDFTVNFNHEVLREVEVKIECTQVNIPKQEQMKDDVETSSNFSKNENNRLCISRNGLETKIFKIISSQSELMKRKKVDKHIKNMLFECDLCHFRTHSAIIISRHIATKHAEKRLFKCDQKHTEKKLFNRDIPKQKTVKHMKNKQLKCDMCDYSTGRSYNLSKHKTSQHTRNKPFKCDMCDYSAARSDHLSQHKTARRTRHKPFKCDVCDYSAAQSDRLSKHKTSKHTEKKAVSTRLHTYPSKRNKRIHTKS